MFDFAPTRALRQLSEYGIGLSPNEPNPENAVRDLVSFLPVLAYDGSSGSELWGSDGQTTGMVSDIFPGFVGSDPMHLTPMGMNRLLFTASVFASPLFTVSHGVSSLRFDSQT